MPTDIYLAERLILKKISEAHDHFAHWGGALRKDPHLSCLLNSLDKKIAASREAGSAFGLALVCRQCSEEDGDTCCGAGIETRYTSRILLINLLLENTLPRKRFWPKGCFFLLENGCSLKVRLVLCINYLCPRIQGILPMEKQSRLQQITGEEMEESFLLEEAVMNFMVVQTLKKSTG